MKRGNTDGRSFITLGLMTVTQVANITTGTTVFAILTALCLYTRVKTKSD